MFQEWQPKEMPRLKKVAFLNLPPGVIFMPLFCYPTSKYTSYLYCLCWAYIFILLLTVWWHLGIECLENWTRLLFFILPFVSACSDVLIFTKGMRQGHIGIRTHTHTLITLPFYLTLRVCGYIYKSRQIWNRCSELIQVGSDEASSLLGNWLREWGRESLLALFVKDTPGKRHRWNHCEFELEGTLGMYLYVYKNTDMCFIVILYLISPYIYPAPHIIPDLGLNKLLLN